MKLKDVWCPHCGCKDFQYIRRDMDLFLAFYYCKRCERIIQMSLYAMDAKLESDKEEFKLREGVSRAG